MNSGDYPPGGYCSVNNQALLANIFWTGNTADAIAGPFTTEEELNDAMIKKYIFNNLPKNKVDFYKRAFPSILPNHHPVFTHGDLQRKNILVQETSPSPDLSVQSTTDYNYKVTVIDRETAGWYPSYWEYARSIFACGRWNDDWSVYVDKVLDPFLTEYAWMLLKALWS
ncbi:putative phosphotransferase enzyme family protein [Venturia nashicola]|uniref:Putative phosphotransferase enzyme family protein n=1 Tax=Venturia nashicola TaxID=86259 RepID=A0A4Z1PC73_9PEZI|nr:putative phosphotransferase enzyme family protein [Venturia nashicola]